MFRLKKPSEAQIIQYLMAQRRERFSYEIVGATQGNNSHGYCVDHERVILGRGQDAFDRAIASVREWKMFPSGSVEKVVVPKDHDVVGEDHQS